MNPDQQAQTLERELRADPDNQALKERYWLAYERCLESPLSAPEQGLLLNERFSSHPATSLIELRGALTRATVEAFEALTQPLQTPWLILDSRHLRYVDGAGTGSLFRSFVQFSQRRGGLAFIRLHPKTQTWFNSLGYDFTYAQTLPAALQLIDRQAASPKPQPE